MVRLLNMSISPNQLCTHTLATGSSTCNISKQKAEFVTVLYKALTDNVRLAQFNLYL